MLKFSKWAVNVVMIAMLFMLFPPVSSPAADSPPANGFTFLHLTDTHLGSGVGNKNTPPVLEAILRNYPNAAFMVHTGDMTELGQPQEYEAYKLAIESLPFPVYNTPGNHESRWTDAGKGYFRNYLGSPYTSWDYQGIHFVTLDSSVAKGQNGHLDKQMLAWLQKDLRGVSKTTPVILFSHHPLFYAEGKTNANFIDNDGDLWPILKGYNVPLILTGHGHINAVWQVNGITVCMTKAAMESGYAVVQVDKGKQVLTVSDIVVGDASTPGEGPTVLTTVSLLKPAILPAIKITSPTANQVVKDSLLLQAQAENWPEPPQSMDYRLDSGSWKPLDPGDKGYQKTIDLSEVDDGNRVLSIRGMDSSGRYYVERITIRVSQKPDVKVAWEFHADGAIQNSPVAGNQYVYIGDNSGKVYALQAATGKKAWEFTTGGAIIASPCWANGNVYAGSTDGKIYAINAATGKKVWDYQTGGAIVAQPLAADGMLLVGSGDFNLYALDEQSGKLLWKFATGNTIMSRPAYGQGTVYFGSWDNKFYAVDVASGQEKWHNILGEQVYYAPAAGAPLYYQGKVYISTPGNRIVAYDGTSGQSLWEATASAGLSSPIIFNDAVLYSDLSGNLFALDPETGENVWQVWTGQSNYGASPVAHGGYLLLNSLTGKVTSVNTSETNPNWSFNVGNTYLFGDSATMANTIFIGTMEGKILALATPAGTQPKPFPLLTVFTDTGNNWARRDLNQLAKLDLIKGFTDGSYHPDDPVTRAELCVMLSRYLKAEQPTPAYKTTFVDISKHWAAVPISAMQEKGIAGGYKDAEGRLSFKPDQKTNRAEAVVMLARALGLSKPSDGFKTKFEDIDKHWAKDAIMVLEEKGLIGGYTENDKLLFKPDNPLSRAEIGVLLLRMFKQSPAQALS